MEATEQEFLDILDKNEGQLMHLCRTYAGRVEEQKDLYQDIIIQIWQSLPEFNGKARLSTWMYRIGVNTAISFVRKKTARQNYHNEYQKEKESTTDIHTEKEKNEDKGIDALYNAISTLNASEKAIISMHLEGFTYAEISYVTDITENYVGVKLNRIKNKLSKILGD